MASSRSRKRFRDFEGERGMLVKETCTLAVIQVSVGGRIRGEPGAARAFCGIDYSLLSRCTSRVKSTPLHPPPSLSHLLFPIQRSPPTPLPPSISFLPSSYFFFFFSFPPFCPVSLLPSSSPSPSLPAGIFLSPASWLTCEPSRITGEQSH